MNKIAFAAAALAALLGAVSLFLYKRRFEHEAVGGAKVAVVVATGELPLGAKITEDKVATRLVPEDYLNSRFVRAVDSQRILGLPLRTQLEAGEFILWTDLATSTVSARGLSVMIPTSMRAIAVPASLESAFGGLLRPGDRADVLLTTDQLGNEDRRVTDTLLQNVLILAVGSDVGEPTEGTGRLERIRQTTVTLLVSPEEAQILTFAQDRGRLAISLRNPDDIRVEQKMAETTAEKILVPSTTPKPTPTTPRVIDEIARDIERVH
jgi:pilus assembly protein CpaB